MRTGTSGPTGTTSWEKTPVFNQAAYDAALAQYNPGSQGTWQPESSTYDNQGQLITTPGQWVGATGPTGTMPNRDDFTSYNWTQKTTLSPEQQAIFDATQKSQLGTANLLGDLTQNVSDGLSNPMDWGGIPELQGLDLGRSNRLAGESDTYARGLADRSLGDNFSTGLSDAIYRQQTRYLDPQMAQERERLQANLADQGFVPGTPGYDRAMANFMDTSNRSYGAARDSAIAQGYSQGNTQLGLQNQIAQLLAGNQTGAFGQALSGGQFGNQARAQAIAEALQRRAQPLNELNAIRSGTQVGIPQASGTSQTPNLSPSDILGQFGQQYQGQLGQYGSNVASNNQLLSGLASAAMLFFSDRRLKGNIRPTGPGWYSWTWADGSPGWGVIAQEHLDKAVVGPGGFLMIDYRGVW